MPAVALTDQANLFALVKFYQACLDQGVKPLVGADLRVESASGELARTAVLAMNTAGYRNLLALVSEAYVDTDTRGAVSRERLFARAEGLLVLSGGRDGEIGQALLKGDEALARTVARDWETAFPGALLRGARAHGPTPGRGLHRPRRRARRRTRSAGRRDQRRLFPRSRRFRGARDPGVHPRRSHAGRPAPRAPLQRGAVSEERGGNGGVVRRHSGSAREHRRDRASLQRRGGARHLLPAQLSRTRRGHAWRTFSRSRQPRACASAWPWLAELGELERPETDYWQRLEYELGIINQMGFPGYFLIVMEFIGWAKAQGIPVGPGRGSGSGSLVAYALGITDMDPIGYDLLFERFLNPERVSMPDFDIDFCMEGRDRVIAHVSERYGHEAVSQIITFSTMAAKAVVRDVARVQGKPYALADKLSKLIPFEVGMTLAKAVEQTRELVAFIEQSEEVGEIMEMAYKLEGIVRGVGRHAGGVVIAPSALTDFVPLYVDDQSGGLVSQFDKDDVESAGLVKFDFLGLKTLTIIDWAVAAINAARPAGATPVQIDRIPLDDPRTFELLKSAETTGVFQLESRGMKDLIRRLMPDRFDDIVALVALFRPGPAAVGRRRRLHQPQARSRERGVPAPGNGAGARADLRRDALPGTGDEDRPGAGWLQPGPGGPVAACHGQEEARGNGEGAQAVPGRRQHPRGRPDRRRRHLRPDGEVRGLRLQQVAQRDLRAGVVPDRLAEGPPSGRVHGGDAVGRHAEHRQGGDAGR
jgi:DNA polymerase III subunit alpha